MPTKKLYRIARDEGRLIGFDLLVVGHAELHFTHPSFVTNEKIFEANLATCKILAAAIGAHCFVVTPASLRRVK